MLQALSLNNIRKCMNVDCLVAEIGSTTTVVNAFQLKGEPTFIGRGVHQTTVDTDVREGLSLAILDLKKSLGIDELQYEEFFASSSAAGGLKITVHGLVYDMTARAAKEAALNAGGNIHLITANRLASEHLEKVKQVKPNMIIIAGGTDFGEKDVAFDNLLDVIPLGIPIIYAGNIANHERIKNLNQSHVTLVDNVYPRVDMFNIMPLREAIYKTFEEHIIHAKGMKDIFKMVDHVIIPTPGAVMDATMMLDEIFDGIMTIDVGGATTDVHSISRPKPEFERMLEGEPYQKRTVEGDLGVYINRSLVLDTFKDLEIKQRFGMNKEAVLNVLKSEPFIPGTDLGKKMIDGLTERCVELAIDRHVGDLKKVFTINGYKVIPEGKDCTQVRAICLTGGALLYANESEQILRRYLNKQQTRLVPDVHTPIYKDHDYIFASLGVLSRVYPEQAKILLKKTLRI